MRLRRLGVRMLVCLAGIGIAWAVGFGWFVSRALFPYPTNPTETDAIVVLTGAPGRIPYGLNLLADGKAKRLFITGMETPTTPQTLVRDAGIPPGRIPQPDRAITLGFVARNTIGNALEATGWIHKEHIRSVRLVTSDYHMPRAMEEFHYELPDVRFIADPLPTKGGADPALLIGEYHKFLAGRLRRNLISLVERFS